MSDDELVSKLNEELENELTDENIDLVIEYMKKNVDSDNFDLSNITYEKDEEGNYVIKFDEYEMKIPKKTTVNDSINTINTAFSIDNPSVGTTPSPANNNQGYNGNNYSKTAGAFNIAIPLDLYTEVIDNLNACNTELQDEFAADYESSSLSGDLASFYHNHYGESYINKYNEMKTSNKTLSDKVQTSLMYYLSIDQGLESNMDTIIDSIFSGDYDITQMMYGMNEDVNTTLSYEQYLEMLNDNESYFNEQRCQYLANFMMQMESYVDEFKASQVPKMLNSIIEMVYYAKNSPTESIDDFKTNISETYWNLVGYPETEGDNSIYNTIPPCYWDGSKENPATKYDQFLMHVSYFDNNFNNVCNILMDNSKDLDRETLIHIFPGDLMGTPGNERDNYSEFGRLTTITEGFNDIYQEHLRIKEKFLSKVMVSEEPAVFDYTKLTTEEVKSLCDDYKKLFSLEDNEKLKNLKTIYDQSMSPGGTVAKGINNLFNPEKLIQYFGWTTQGGLVDPYNMAGYTEESHNKALVRALADYYGITDEETIQGMIDSGEYANDLNAIPSMIAKIYNKDGLDKVCSFLATYFNNVESYNGKTYPDPCKFFEKELTAEDIKKYIFDGNNSINVFNFTSYAQMGNLFNFTTQIASDFGSQMAYLRSTQETYEMYFAKKLDKSIIGEKGSDTYNYYVGEAKKALKNAGYTDDDLKYLADWQLDALAVMISKNYENDDTTWARFLTGDNHSPRGSIDSLIIQGRAYDEAKSTVDVMTAGGNDFYGYLWSTLSGFSVGVYDGVDNFISGIENVWAADGEVSQSEYKQQFIHQLLTTDYAPFNAYKNGEYDALFSTDYSNVDVARYKINDMTDSDVDEMIAYAKENGIPRYELEHMLGIISDEDYAKYNNIYSLANSEDKTEYDYYMKLAARDGLTDYTNVVYSVGTGVGNMLIPLTLNLLSAYCPALEFVSIGLTALSTTGRTRESLMQQGYTDNTMIWLNSIAHGVIEGLGEAVFGKVLKTNWGKKVFTKLEQIPGLGKVLSMTDNFIGKIDNLPFGSDTFKQFLKNDLGEILEELGENVWGYIADGFMFGDWPSGQEILDESWSTIWQTALTTPLLNAFSTVGSRTLKKKVTLANGLTVTLSLAELQMFQDGNGHINNQDLFKYLSINNRIEGNWNDTTCVTNLNNTLGLEVVEEAHIYDGKYHIKLRNGQELDFDIANEGADIFSKIVAVCPEVLTSAINSGSTNRIKNIVNNIDGGTLARLTMTMSGDQVASIINTLDVDMNNRESVVRLLDCVELLRPAQANETLFKAFTQKLGLDGKLDTNSQNLINTFLNDSTVEGWKKAGLSPNMSIAELFNSIIAGNTDYDISKITARDKGMSDADYADRMFDRTMELLIKANPNLTADEIDGYRKRYNKLTTIEAKQEFLLGKYETDSTTGNKTYKGGGIFPPTLQEAYRSMQYYNGMFSLRQTYDMYQMGYYDSSYSFEDVIVNRYLAYKGVIQEQAKVITAKNGTNYNDVFPAMDSFISDSRAASYLTDLAGQEHYRAARAYAESHGIDFDNDPIQGWGEYLRYMKSQGTPVTTKGLTFQSASRWGNNYLAFGGDVGRPDGGPNGDNTGGYLMRVVSYQQLADDYPDICSYNPNTGEFTILNYERFGNEVVGGVPTIGGIYMIETEVPIEECSMPSMSNGGAFPNYGGPGGNLHISYGIETVVPQQHVSGDSTAMNMPSLPKGTKVTVVTPSGTTITITKK